MSKHILVRIPMQTARDALKGLSLAKDALPRGGPTRPAVRRLRAAIWEGIRDEEDMACYPDPPQELNISAETIASVKPGESEGFDGDGNEIPTPPGADGGAHGGNDA